MIEVWIEGYQATCEKAGAKRLGVFDVASDATFEDAVQFWLDTQSADDVKRFYRKRDDGTMTYWSCRFFDNEEDARKSYG